MIACLISNVMLSLVQPTKSKQLYSSFHMYSIHHYLGKGKLRLYNINHTILIAQN